MKFYMKLKLIIEFLLLQIFFMLNKNCYLILLEVKELLLKDVAM